MAERATDNALGLMGVGENVEPALIPADAVVRRRGRTRRLALGILVLFDLAVVYGAFVAAYWVRYDLRIGPAIRDQLGFAAWTPLILPVLLLMLVALWAKGAYRLRMGDEIQDDLISAFSAATIAVATLVVLTSMLHRYEYSRAVIIYLWLALIIFVTAGRWAFRAVIGYLHRRGVAVRRLVVVGATDVGKMIMQSVASRRDLGYDLVGFVHAGNGFAAAAERPSGDFGRFRNLGLAADVPALISREQVDEVIIALPAAAHEDIWPILQQCERDGVGLKIVPDTFELNLSRVHVDDIGGIPIFDVREQPLRRLKLAAKQSAEWVLAGALSLIFAPVMLLTASLIRLDSPGSPMYVQERVGQDGRRFRCYKFRSMQVGADDRVDELFALNHTQGPTFKAKDDPRFTRVGRFLRRHSLDELPQLFNILKGDMALVGPRPALPAEVERYETGHRRRLRIRPGLTGMWQVSGRSDLTFDEMVTMDNYYIENWSFSLDVKIILRTVAAMVTGRGAY